jgi:hypothetical protein
MITYAHTGEWNDHYIGYVAENTESPIENRIWNNHCGYVP